MSRRRVSHWDRPPAPKDFRWFLRLVGKVLICTGMLMFGFVAYQLWGTGIEYARAQNRLDNEFEELMAQFATTSTSSTSTSTTSSTTTLPQVIVPGSSDETTTSTTTSTTTPTTTTTVAPITPDFSEIVRAMALTEGSTIASIEIPEMELNDIVVAGVEREQLALGPGLYPQTPMPGQLGNSAIAGHRTTHGQPFYDINDLEPGDEIIITTVYGRFVYIVTSFEIVAPSQMEVIATTDPSKATLTLTSCHPRFSASQRYIVYADLDLTQSSPPGQPIYNYGRDVPLPTNTAIPGDDPTIATPTPPTEVTTTSALVGPTVAAGTGETIVTETTAVTATTLPSTTATPDTLYTVVPGGGTEGGGEGPPSGLDGDALSNRWFSDKSAFLPVAEWAAACAAVVIASYLLAKRLRNSWIGLAVAVLPFIVGLYFFYENVNRLLPAAL